MKTRRLLAATVLLVASLGACSDEASDVTQPVDVDEEITENDGDVADEVLPDAPAGGEAAALTGAVGTPEDPNAFEITLLGPDGEVVETLPAGTYVIEVEDLSEIHNWHLVGPGDVDVQTSVADVETETFEVVLEPGEYTYVCDPHVSTMSGTFEVV